MFRLIKTLLASALCLPLSITSSLAQSGDDAIPCDVPYEIVSGDTLAKIASRAYGPDHLDAFYELNKAVIGENRDLIFIGMKLNVPCGLNPELVRSVMEADFSAAPQQDESQTTEAGKAPPEGTEVLLVFNRAAAPKFILNVAIIDEYLEQISEVTQGRVRFTDPPETERNPRVQYDIVRSGTVDGAYVFNGHLALSHPLLQLPMQPLMGGTAQQTALSLWQLHERYLARTDYLDDVHLLGFVGAPAAHIWRLKELPVSPGENVSESNEYTVPYFDGLDTRGAAAVQQENAAWLAQFDEEQDRSLTMVMAHGAALAGGIWKDNNRVVTEIRNGVYTPTFSVMLSNNAWNKISPVDQKAILAISGEALAKRSAAWDTFDDGLRLKMLDMGLETIEAGKALLAELQDQSRTGLENWIAAADAKGLPGFEAVNNYTDKLQSANPAVK